MTTPVLALAAALTTLGAASPTSPPDSLAGPGVEVPYVGQDPLLCGGAALAMVFRFWGETGVYADDFRALVHESEGGIRTTDLAAAADRRGYEVLVTHGADGAAEEVFGALEVGAPAILLLDSNLPTLHYVVLVQADGHDVWVHDPAVGPMRRMSREELRHRWGASGHWALVVVPERKGSGEGGASERRSDEAGTGVAEDPADEAIARLRAGRYDEAARRARRMVALGGEQARTGRRILATSYYLSGETDRALEEWNVLGEPDVDLVNIHGGVASRHDVLVRRTGIDTGDRLTPTSLALARRRLEEEPSLLASRVEYRPNRDGTVQVHAYVVERHTLPTPPRLGVEAVRGLVSREAGLDAGPLIGSADRWRLEGGWSPEHSFVGGSVRAVAPPVPGVVRVGLEWTRERYAIESGPSGSEGTVASEARLRGSVGLREWIDANTRVGAALGLERWRTGARFASATVEWLRENRTLRTSATVDGWLGSGSGYWRATAGLEARVASGEHQSWRARLGAVTTSDGAPRMVWPGAGTGRIRSALLRGYPLAEGDVIDGPAFGPHLVHASLEYRLASRFGPFRYGTGLFTDAAYLPAAPPAAGSAPLTDVGLELFVDPGGSEAALSLARGSRGWVLSARVTESW